MSEPVQRLCLQVAVPEGMAFGSIEAEIDRLGESRTLRLVDDGSVNGDSQWDGIHTAWTTGPYARYVSVRIHGGSPGEVPRLLYAGVERTEDEGLVLLAWKVQALPSGEWVALRATSAWPGNQLGVIESLPLVAAFGWGLLVTAWVGLLLHHRRGAGR